MFVEFHVCTNSQKFYLQQTTPTHNGLHQVGCCESWTKFFLRNVAKRLVMFKTIPENLHKQNSSCIIFFSSSGSKGKKKSLFKELTLFLKFKLCEVPIDLLTLSLNMSNMTFTPYWNIPIWNILDADGKHTQWLGKSRIKILLKDTCVNCDKTFFIHLIFVGIDHSLVL